MQGNTKKKSKKSAAYSLALMGLFVAIESVCAWISIPISEISITLQTFAVCLAGALLGWKRGLFATAAYLLLGAVGVPVFSGFTGGIARLVGPTGGYLIGFLFTAVLSGVGGDLARRMRGKLFFLVAAAFMVLGVLLCYAFGTGWFMILMSGKGNPYTLFSALSLCVVPFLPFDLLKIALATALFSALKNRVS